MMPPEDAGHSVKRVLRYNVVVALVVLLVTVWFASQTATLNPVLAQTYWMNVVVAVWNILIAAVLSKLAYDLYETKN